MPATYFAPGVIVESIDNGVKPIQGVGTSLPAFVGITERAGKPTSADMRPDSFALGEQAFLGKPMLVANWTQYVDLFGGIVAGAYLPDAVYGFFANGGGACYVVSLRTTNGAATAGVSAQPAAVVVPSTRRPSFKVVSRTPGRSDNGLPVIVTAGENDTFTLQIGDERHSGLVWRAGEPNSLATATFTRVEILDIGEHPPKPGQYTLEGGSDAQPAAALTPQDYLGNTDDQTGFCGLEAVDALRLLVCPDIMQGYDGSEEAKTRVRILQAAMVTFCTNTRRCFAILDTPPRLTAGQAIDWRNALRIDSDYAALYYPWVEVANLDGSAALKKLVPPSGLMAGVYNRVDTERGVHKSPANEIMRGVIGLERLITREEVESLNPIGVNCIRAFPTLGIRAYGARTLSSNGAWRYISVRRLFIFVAASLEEGLQWVVFEPNDHMLWAKVRRDITAFLTQVWRSTALFGLTPEQAFYVKCDAELNPAGVRDLGQLIIEVGLAPVKPAEFVIVRISQWAGANAEP